MLWFGSCFVAGGWRGSGEAAAEHADGAVQQAGAAGLQRVPGRPAQVRADSAADHRRGEYWVLVLLPVMGRTVTKLQTQNYYGTHVMCPNLDIEIAKVHKHDDFLLLGRKESNSYDQYLAQLGKCSRSWVLCCAMLCRLCCAVCMWTFHGGMNSNLYTYVYVKHTWMRHVCTY